MHKITIGPHLHYVLRLMLIFFTLTSLKSAGEYYNISISVAGKTNASCPDASDGAISISVSGGTGPYTYDWTGPNSYSNNTKDISGLIAGTYTITVTDSSTPDAESETINVTIDDIDSDAPSITAPSDISESTDSNDCNASSINLGSPTTNDNCGVASVTNNAPSNFPLGETVVTWTVTDNSGNTATDTQTVVIADNTNPTITAPADINTVTDSNDCNASNLNLGSPITDDNCNVASVSNDAPTDFPLGVTTVTWTVTDDAGNTSTDTQKVTITDDTPPSITAPGDLDVSTDNNDCNASNVNLGSATTNDNCNVASVTNDAPADFPLGVTTVTWTVTDDAGNSSTDTQKVTVTDDTPPSITAPANVQADSDTDDCNASSVNLGVPATSDNCNVALVTNDAPVDFPLGVTTVTWTVTDDAGNTNTATQSVTITDNTKPVISANSDIIVTNDPGKCEAVVNITTATATDNCSVPAPVGTRDDGLNLSDAYPVGSTVITWNVTDDNGNAADPVTQTITVNDNEAPVLPTVEDVLWGCSYTVEAPVTTDNCSGNITGTTSDPLTYDTSGTYNITWTFTDDEGNSSQLTQEIVIDELTVAVSVTNVDCNGFATGSANATASGGVLPYTYSWTSLGSGSSKTNLEAGTYELTVTDGNGCQISQNVIITEPDALSMTDPGSTEVTCYGGADGTITVGTMSGGSGNYEYSLDNTNFTTSTTFTDLEAGNYTIFVKDENGCSLQKTISVTQPVALTATLNKTNIACYGENTGNITISGAQGGHGNYEYSIDGTNWQAGSSFNNLFSGSYKVYIRDADNPSCTVILNDNYQLTQPNAALTAQVSATRTTTYGSASGTATANPSGGTPGYTYQWREAGSSNVIQTTKTATNLLAGDYEVTVTDSKGCTFTQSITILDAIEAFIASRSVCEDEGDQSAIRTSYFEVNNQTAVGGVGPYTYSWDFGSGATNPTRTGIGEHTVYYSSTGNKTVTLVVTDSTGETFSVTQQNYVGNCYEPCGKSENFVFDPNNIYIGDANGNPLSIADQLLCDNSVPKFIYIAVDKSANAYNPYIELIYKISNTNTPGETFVSYAGGCRSGDDIDDDPNDNKENKIGEFIKLTINPIDFECGDNLDIENFYVTWTNVEHKKCGQNNNAFCYSQDEPVVVPTPLSAVAKPTHILCKGDSTGSISVSVSGGYAPYTFNMTGPNASYDSSNNFQNLPAGEHTVYVRDSRGNTTSVSATINEPSTSVSASTTVVDPTCFGELGEASVTAQGGTPFEDGTYEYLWNDPSEQTTSTATGLPAGEYTVTVIDANGCQTISTVNITEPAELTTAETGEDQIFSCGFTTTNLKANTAEVGTGEWTLISGTGGNIANPSDPNSEFTGSNGTYTLRWTIANSDGSCATASDMTVTFENDCNTLDFDGVDDYVTFLDNYALNSGTFTIEVWVRPKSVTGVRTVLSKRDYSNMNNGGFDLIINNGAPTFRWGSSSVSTSSKVGTNRWYHLAVIYKSSSIELYVDGIKVGNSSASNPALTSAPFILGAIYNSTSPDTPKNHYHGWMEELRIWNTSLTANQLRFMMNQRVENNGGNTKGEVLPMNVPNSLSWSNLKGYYRLFPNEIINGETPDISNTPVNGFLKNIETTQKNTAPLPYISESTGSWRNRSTWDTNIGNENENWWDVPNGKGINGDYINWNIARISHNINSGSENIYLLGLLSESGELKVDGNVSAGTGQGLTVTTYLELDGNINLEGQSQLVQTEGSILEETSTGYIDIDQQGTENSFNYNYWSSPVSLQNNTANNTGFKLKEVLMDGSNTTPSAISFNGQYHWADGNYSGNARISTYWLYTFQGVADDYSEWHRFSENDLLAPGVGFTMKGTHGWVPVSNRQNYTFRGKPNNADISLNISSGQNLLIGNPYPSAIDATMFIQENLGSFNGSIYYWDHFGPENSHYLHEYVGGYAVFNLSGGIQAATSSDARINNNGQSGDKIPGNYIPVAQAFFVNSQGVSNPGTITFKNEQRAFVKESVGNSQFLAQEYPTKDKQAIFSKDSRYKIRLKFSSPKGYNRHILVTADAKTTNEFDLGYDAPLIDNIPEDMYWMIGQSEFVIQAVPNFNYDQVLPLGIKIAEEDEFTIEIEKLENFTKNVNIYLHNKEDDTYHNLSVKSYRATEAPGSYNDKYEIVFTKPETEGETGKDKPVVTETPRIIVDYLRDTKEIAIANPDLLQIEHVQLFSMSGQVIKSFEDIQSEKSIRLKVERPLSSAVYIVKVFTSENKYSRKVIIKE